MFLAVCFDASMLVGFLFFVLITGALILTSVIFGLTALARWADARQKRLAVEDLR
ncbi:MAG TPA: hypothetical protein VF588_00805 [Pyrinomonadaceae bacterium]|jgi:hypothetical protein